MSAGPQVRALVCPNCGSAVTLRGYAQTVNAVCEHCLTILDTRSPSLAVLQSFGSRERFEPLIPLGQRGRLRGAPFEVIGFQVRAIVVEGVVYRWTEYLLFNPYRGYRYLTEYNGHWNLIRGITALPQPAGGFGSKPRVRYRDRVYAHFQRATARTVYVMGEFPWQVRVGDAVEVNDYVDPPYSLSNEITPEETLWSHGEYLPGRDVWQAFQLPGSPPKPDGIYSNQPSPYGGKVFSIWKTFAAMLLILAGIAFTMAILHRDEVVFRQRYSYSTNASGDAAFVTSPFPMKGREAPVEVEIDTDLSNNWAYFNVALINNETGNVWDAGKEVSYYFGRDSDGNWSEGRRRAAITMPDVPPGTYYLRVEPEMERISSGFGSSMNYGITVRRDIPTYWPYAAAGILLLIPPLLVTVRRFSFEHARWQESDYGSPYSSSSSEDDE